MSRRYRLALIATENPDAPAPWGEDELLLGDDLVIGEYDNLALLAQDAVTFFKSYVSRDALEAWKEALRPDDE